MDIKLRVTPEKKFEVYRDKAWKELSRDDYSELLSDGAVVVPYQEDKSLDINVKFSDGSALERVDLNGNYIRFKFVGEDVQEKETDDASVYFDWIQSALQHNKSEKIESLYQEIFAEAIQESEDSSIREEVTITPNPEEGASEEQSATEENKIDTVESFYSYVTDKNNPIDVEFLKRFNAEEEVETLAGDAYRVSEIKLPIVDDAEIFCKILVGYKDGTEAGFVCLPDSWETAKDVEATVEGIENLNQDISCNVIVDEAFVLEDPTVFYQDLGDLYGTSSAYIHKDDVVQTSLEDPNEAGSEESSVEDSPEEITEPEEATLLDIETSTDNIDFESTCVRYKPGQNEQWLMEFHKTDDFMSKVKAYQKDLNEKLRPSLREYVTYLLGESENFIAVRVDKAGILEKSTNEGWFKKRVTSICESIKKTAKDLRIVETRGNYYVRTFFLVEATKDNYCLCSEADAPEFILKDDKTLYEDKPVVVTDELKSYLISPEGGEEFRVIQKPPVIADDGRDITYKVDNDGKVPCFVKSGDGFRLVMIPEEIISSLTIEEPAPEEILSPDSALVGHDDTYIVDVDDTISTDSSVVAPPSLQDLFDNLSNEESWVEECDYNSGFTVKVTPILTDTGKEVLLSKVLDKTVFVIPSDILGIDEYAAKPVVIYDEKGHPTSCGDACDRFLEVLARKYGCI